MKTISDWMSRRLPSGREHVSAALLRCCESRAWVEEVISQHPFADDAELDVRASDIWYGLSEGDWREAFLGHPQIGGDVSELRKKYGATSDWALSEQSGVQTAADTTLEGLADANRDYLKRFGYIFIVCASGKSAEEMLGLLRARLTNHPQDEIRIAAIEQMRITRIRLNKLAASIEAGDTDKERP